MSAQEKKLGLVHRVLAAARHGMREYAILITERRSVFIEQPKSRGSFSLRTEMLFGPSGKSDLRPRTLEDYAEVSVESLAREEQNIAVPHGCVTKLMVGIGGLYPVYHFDLAYRLEEQNRGVLFYAVPLSSYMDDRAKEPREVVLRGYADGIFRLYQQVLPPGVVENLGLGDQQDRR